MRYQGYAPGFKNLAADDGQGGENVQVLAHQPSSVTARQF